MKKEKILKTEWEQSHESPENSKTKVLFRRRQTIGSQQKNIPLCFCQSSSSWLRDYATGSTVIAEDTEKKSARSWFCCLNWDSGDGSRLDSLRYFRKTAAMKPIKAHYLASLFCWLQLEKNYWNWNLTCSSPTLRLGSISPSTELLSHRKQCMSQHRQFWLYAACPASSH